MRTGAQLEHNALPLSIFITVLELQLTVGSPKRQK